MSRHAFLSLTVLLLALSTAPAQPSPRDRKVLDDKQKVEADGFWIYNDMPKAFAEAKATGKPIVVCLRCIPCVECVKLDDDLVNTDPRLKPLLDKFVRVRIVSTNGLDLSQFQYDTDQSFAVFLLNADGTVYGRFGTRSHRTNWVGDVSLDGMAKAMQGALDLHADHAKVKDSLAAKRGPAPEFPTPEKFPFLTGKYTSRIDFKAANVGQGCIHCHQIGDARKAYYRQKKEPMPEHVLFPYPHPKSLGLILDPKEKATVSQVDKGSLAETAGFRAGDAIRSLNGQPLLSIADVQWVLHNTPAAGGTLKAEVQRGGKLEAVTLELPAGWRRKDDMTWRASTWPLRRMATGGLVFEPAPDGAASTPTLKIQRVGTFGAHAAGQKAGFKQGDVILSWDGKTFAREADLIAHGVTMRNAGDVIPVTVLRGGKKVELKLPMQE